MHDVIPVDRLHAGQRLNVWLHGTRERHEDVTVLWYEVVDLGMSSLGGRCTRRRVTLQLADGTSLSLLNALNAFYTTLERTEYEWCAECRTRVEVEERSDESTYEGHHEVGYHVTRLVCGHTTQTKGRIIGRSPGGEAAAEAIGGDRTRRRMERTYAAYDEANR